MRFGLLGHEPIEIDELDPQLGDVGGDIGRQGKIDDTNDWRSPKLGPSNRHGLGPRAGDEHIGALQNDRQVGERHRRTADRCGKPLGAVQRTVCAPYLRPRGSGRAGCEAGHRTGPDDEHAAAGQVPAGAGQA